MFGDLIHQWLVLALLPVYYGRIVLNLEDFFFSLNKEMNWNLTWLSILMSLTGTLGRVKKENWQEGNGVGLIEFRRFETKP